MTEDLPPGLPQSMTGEEQDPLELLVVKEEVEGPQGALLSIGVRVQIRIITTWK